MKLRGVAQPRSVSFPGYEEFNFATGAVKEGVQDDRRNEWHRGDYAVSDADSEMPADAGPAGTTTRPLKSVALTLDNAGGGKASLAGIPKQDTPQQIISRAGIQRSERRGRDCLHAHCGVAGGPRCRTQARFLGTVERQGEVPGARPRSGRQAATGCRRQDRSVRAQDVFSSQAFDRRLLCVPERHASRAAQDGVRRSQRREGTGVLRVRIARVRRGFVAGERERRAGERRVDQQFGVDRRKRGMVVRCRQRPHRPASREEALRAGATARFQVRMPFKEGDRARHPRARRRDRRVREEVWAEPIRCSMCR